MLIFTFWQSLLIFGKKGLQGKSIFPLERTVAEIDLLEINEIFGSQVSSTRNPKNPDFLHIQHKTKMVNLAKLWFLVENLSRGDIGLGHLN